MKNKNIIILSIFLLIKCIINFINDKNKDLKNIRTETIMSNIGDPFLTENMLAPLTIPLTSDQPDENGGLSYQKKYTNDLNIKLIHDFYKDNYNIILPADTKIVFGSGSSMVTPAFYYAIQKKENRSITVKSNLEIFYTPHKIATTILKNVEWVNSTSPSDLTVTATPNNPNGFITDPTTINSKYKLFDVVYDVYIFTGLYKTINPEVYKEFETNKNIGIISSFSKLGIAGVRFGFILTRDEEIARYATEYINILLVSYSSASATIARLTYYKYLRSKSRNEMIYNIINERRAFFIKYAKKNGIEILNFTFNNPYIYTNKSTAWWLETFNVSTRTGIDYNDTKENSCFL